MSYILDALKQSQASREAGAMDRLRTAPAPKTRPSLGALPWPGIMIGMGLAAAVAAATLWLTRAPTPVAAVADADALSVTGPVTRGASEPRVAGVQPAAAPVTPDASEAPVAAVQVAATAAPKRTVIESVTAAIAPPVQAPPPVSRQPPEPVPSEKPPTPSISRVAETTPDPAPKPAEPQVPEIHDLSFEVRRGLPKLAIQVHTYDADPARRFALINLRKYREGDVLAEGVTLLRITRQGLILDYQGLRYRVSK